MMSHRFLGVRHYNNSLSSSRFTSSSTILYSFRLFLREVFQLVFKRLMRPASWGNSFRSPNQEHAKPTSTSNRMNILKLRFIGVNCINLISHSAGSRSRYAQIIDVVTTVITNGAEKERGGSASMLQFAESTYGYDPWTA